MASEEKKIKKYRVTFSMRLGGTWMKILFIAAVALGAFAVIGGIIGLVARKGIIIGPAILAAFLCVLWTLAISFMSHSAYGNTTISFNEKYIRFWTKAKNYDLNWDDAVSCGIVKTWRTYWVYVSDHKLEDTELKQFPENVKLGVMYYEYDTPTWNEFIKFVPEDMLKTLTARKAELKIKETIKEK